MASNRYRYDLAKGRSTTRFVAPLTSPTLDRELLKHPSSGTAVVQFESQAGPLHKSGAPNTEPTGVDEPRAILSLHDLPTVPAGAACPGSTSVQHEASQILLPPAIIKQSGASLSIAIHPPAELVGHYISQASLHVSLITSGLRPPGNSSYDLEPATVKLEISTRSQPLQSGEHLWLCDARRPDDKHAQHGAMLWLNSLSV